MTERLKAGIKILFVGLPCQVSAVKHYTKNHQNLYTIILLCHGTLSPMILEKILKDYGIELKKVENIRFRVKITLRWNKTISVLLFQQ